MAISDKHRPVNCDTANRADDVAAGARSIPNTTLAGRLPAHGKYDKRGRVVRDTGATVN